MAQRKTPLLAGLLTGVFLSVGGAQAQTLTVEAPIKTVEIVQTAPALDIEGMTEWRQDFHAHPETAYEETRTAAKIDELLTSWGIETHTNIGKTGVVGILKGKQTGENSPSICLRADMDALSMTEADTTLSYRSQTPGKMHACGHDGHTAMLLGAAKYLSESKNFTGTVYFVFQPAEEGGAGAKAMIDDGLFDIVDCDGMYGMHTWPSLPAGKIGIAEGNITANSDRFTIKITGKGGHAAYPANNIDVVAMASELVTALHDYKGDNVPETEGAVLAVTNMHGGEALNAMPEILELGGTVRTFTDDTQDKLEKAITDIAERLAKEYGATVDVEYKRGYPSVFNSAEQTQNAREAAIEALGADNIVEFKRTMAGEDFAYFNDHAPGSYVALGQGKTDGSKNTHLHSPTFNFNDAVLKNGAQYWVNLVENELPVQSAKPAPVKPQSNTP